MGKRNPNVTDLECPFAAAYEHRRALPTSSEMASTLHGWRTVPTTCLCDHHLGRP